MHAVTALLTVVLLAAPPPPPAKPSPAPKSDAQLLKEFGTALLDSAPAAVKNGTPIDKAQYGFSRYCDMLAQGNVPVNSSLWNRFQNLVRNGDATKWTCGDHANNLEALFTGLGIKEQMPMISADGASSLPTPNSDHGALAVSWGGKAYFFDAWQLAVQTGSYKGADQSKWNGMEASAWEAEMKKQGYVRFSDDATNWREGIAEPLAKYLKPASGDLLHPPKDLKGVSKEQLKASLDALKAKHRALQEELVKLPPTAEQTADQIRGEQKSLYKDAMRIKAELEGRK